MNKTRALSAFLTLAILSVVLAACGGSDDDGSTDTEAASVPSQAAAPATPSDPGATAKAGKAPAGGDGDKKQSDGGSGSSQGDDGPGGSEGTQPASLDTDPGAIRGAVVTSTGAVQTLDPSEEGQAEAMENSYSSIKGFGEEASGSEATDITFALVQYLTARANRDWATACARIYTPLRESFVKAAEKSEDPAVQAGGCPAVLGALMGGQSQAASAEMAEIDVASVRRGDSNRAFVIYKTPNTVSADMPMYFDNGIWTVGAIEAYVLTPQQLAENQK